MQNFKDHSGSSGTVKPTVDAHKRPSAGPAISIIKWRTVTLGPLSGVSLTESLLQHTRKLYCWATTTTVTDDSSKSDSSDSSTPY